MNSPLLYNNELLIRMTMDAILFFLAISVVGLLILTLIKTGINLYFSAIQRREAYWLPHLNRYLAGDASIVRLPIRSLDLIPLSRALCHIRPENRTQREKLCHLIYTMELDRKLAERFRRTRMLFRRVFYLSTLSELPCTRIKPFYLDVMVRQSDPRLLRHAIYAYSKTVSDADEMKGFIAFLLKFDRISHIGRNYCKFLIFIAMRRLTYPELERFIREITAQPPEIRMLRCIVDSIGRLESTSMEALLLHFYHTFREADEVVAGVLRSLVKCGVKNCDILRETVEREELPIRIACSKVGLELCYETEQILERVARYFFDANYYVRQNIYETCKRHHISKETILHAVHRCCPDRIHDRFFNDMLSSYSFVR